MDTRDCSLFVEGSCAVTALSHCSANLGEGSATSRLFPHLPCGWFRSITPQRRGRWGHPFKVRLKAASPTSSSSPAVNCHSSSQPTGLHTANRIGLSLLAVVIQLHLALALSSIAVFVASAALNLPSANGEQLTGRETKKCPPSGRLCSACPRGIRDSGVVNPTTENCKYQG